MNLRFIAIRVINMPVEFVLISALTNTICFRVNQILNNIGYPIIITPLIKNTNSVYQG